MAKKKKTDTHEIPCPFCGSHEVGESVASKNLTQCGAKECGLWSTRATTASKPKEQEVETESPETEQEEN